jgi:hypothetical protein
MGTGKPLNFTYVQMYDPVITTGLQLPSADTGKEQYRDDRMAIAFAMFSTVPPMGGGAAYHDFCGPAPGRNQRECMGLQEYQAMPSLCDIPQVSGLCTLSSSWVCQELIAD